MHTIKNSPRNRCKYQHRTAEKHALDLKKILQQKQHVINNLEKAIATDLKQNNIPVIFENVENIHQNGQNYHIETDNETYSATSIIIATGSVPTTLPQFPIDGKYFITSDHALSPEYIPEKLLVVGAGAIGLELGQLYSYLGSDVTIIEMLPRLLPELDPDVVTQAIRALKSPKLNIIPGTTLENAKIQNNTISADIITNNKRTTIECNQILFAIGRKPDLKIPQTLQLQLTNKNRVAVDSHYQTSALSVFAIGDIINGPMLAHKAENDAKNCIFGIHALAEELIPSIIYTNPEIAHIGKKYDDAKVIIKPLRSNARSMTMARETGIIKAEFRNKKMTRAQIVAPAASEIILQTQYAIHNNTRPSASNRLCYPHPTLSELIKEINFQIEPKPVRQYERYPINIDINIDNEPAIAKNVSYGGLFALSPVEFTVNTVVLVKIGTDPDPLELSAIVRRVDIAADMYGIGLQFSPTDEQRNKLMLARIQTYRNNK